jgi:hypothetical protein
MKYQCIAQCNNGTATPAELEYLYEHDREITKKTFARHVDMKELCEYLGYSYGHINRGLSFFNDWHIRCYVSRFREKRVWHLVWSEIDHVFGDDSLRHAKKQTYSPFDDSSEHHESFA